LLWWVGSHMKRRYRRGASPHRAIELFHIGMWTHLYLSVMFLLVLVSVHAWVVIAFWVLGFLHDIYVFMRIASATRTQRGFSGFFWFD